MITDLIMPATRSLLPGKFWFCYVLYWFVDIARITFSSSV